MILLEKKTKRKIWGIVKFLPFILCIVFMCLYLFSGEEITVQKLLNFAPENPVFAAIFMMLLYVFKSLTIFFPIIILNILGGFLFEPIHALIVNAVGVILGLTVPYWIGRLSGTDFTAKIRAKYPKIAEFIYIEGDNRFFASFFLRIISCLPGDVVSMYFGANKMPYMPYICGSFIGSFPGTVAATLLGMSITDTSSPMFWFSIGLTVGLSLISIIAYFLWRKFKKKKDCETNEQ